MYFRMGGGGGNSAQLAQQQAQIEALQTKNQQLADQLDTREADELKAKQKKLETNALSRTFNQSTRRLTTGLVGDDTLSSGSLLSLGSTLG